jgi:metal-responsive CopG/Arc/MetJ family transcriptional regulator
MSRIILSLPESYVAALDNQAKEESRSRTDIIRELVRGHIEAAEERRQLTKQRSDASRMMDKIRANTAGSDYSASEFVRAWRYRFEE